MWLGLALVAAALLAWAALTRVPLAAVLERTGTGPVTVAATEGTVMDGRLRGLAIGPLPLGDVSVQLRPARLLQGEAAFRLETLPPARRLLADVALTRASVTVDARGLLSLAGAFNNLPVGEVAFAGTSARFERGRCAAARGRVEAVLAVPVALPDRLGGFARCDREALLLPFQDAAGRAGLALRLWGDGRWRADVRLNPPAEAGPALLAQGFRREADNYALTVNSPR